MALRCKPPGRRRSWQARGCQLSDLFAGARPCGVLAVDQRGRHRRLTPRLRYGTEVALAMLQTMRPT